MAAVGGLILVALITLVYSILLTEMNYRVIDRDFVQNFQKRMKELQKEFKEADKKKDIKKMEEITQKQLEHAKHMPKLLGEQVKLSIISLILFFVILWFINAVDPAMHDDINIKTLLVPLSNLNSSLSSAIDGSNGSVYGYGNYGAVIPSSKLKRGYHFVAYELSHEGESCKGELKYGWPSNITNEWKEELSIKHMNNKGKGCFVNLERNSSALLIETNARPSEIEKLVDDNATRTALSFDLFGQHFIIHGVWLIILFSIVWNLIYGRVRPLIFKSKKKETKEKEGLEDKNKSSKK